VLELGRALSLAGTAVSETQQRLLRIAAANGAPDSRVVVLPTVLMVSFGRAQRTFIESIPQRTGALRLDQISALYELIKAAEHGSVPPAVGRSKIAAIGAMEPRYGRLITVLGHTLMTIGLCLLLRPTLRDVGIAAGFGAFVGWLVLLARGRQTLGVLIPVISAMIVSALTFEAVKLGIADPDLRPWLGVVIFGVATALYFSAPRGALRWLLVVVLVAWLGQLAGNALVGANASGFVGAIAMTPVALAVARMPHAPPSQVTFLPAFWLLVPGAIGLIGVTDIIGSPASAGIEDLVQPVTSVVAIALGVLCGASIYRALAAAPRRFRRARRQSGGSVRQSDSWSSSDLPSVTTTTDLTDD
jgi:uncharacterized membrane protein YjjP (DUF1212 family)